jgi:hypothetical protein
MPRGVYPRKASGYQPEGTQPPVPSGGSAAEPPMWQTFNRVRDILAPLDHRDRRAILGALNGWFQDGRYD